MRSIRNWYELLEGSGLVANDSGPAKAHGTLTANVNWLPFYSPPFSTLQCSGTLSPDATGTFHLQGIYNSQPYFHNSDKTYYLWYDSAAGFWYISILLGTVGAAYWEGTAYDDPAFQPQGTATGVATITSDYTIPYDQKGVIIASSVSRITSAAAAAFPAASGSIEMLVRPTWNYTDGASHFLWDTWGGSNRRFLLYKASTNVTYLYTDNTNRGSFTFAWSAHTLYHIVLNWGTNQLYINNVLVNTFTAGGLGSGASTLYIGDHYTSANNSFAGMIYYFIARDLPLTTAEIATFNAFFQKLYIPQIT
jgi:hypothetical protein